MNEEVEIGSTWEVPKIDEHGEVTTVRYVVVSIQNDLVTLAITKNNNTSIKEKSMKKVKKLLSKANENNSSTKNEENLPEEKDSEFKVIGHIFKVETFVGLTLPLAHALSDGTESVFSFTADSNRLLIGKSVSDNNPVWTSPKNILPLVDPNFLESISAMKFDGTGEDIKKQVLDFLKNQ